MIRSPGALRGLGAAALVVSLALLGAAAFLADLTIRRPAAARVALPQANASPRPVRDIPYAQAINEAGRRHSINPALLAGLVAVESRFLPSARSRRGAIGLAQVLPSTWRELRRHVPCSLPADRTEECLLDPEVNLAAGALYLRRLLDRYRQDAELALAAYNAGAARVDTYGGPPPFRETGRYLDLVALAWSEAQARGTLSPWRRTLLAGFDYWIRMRNQLTIASGVLLVVSLLWLNSAAAAERSFNRKGAREIYPN